MQILFIVFTIYADIFLSQLNICYVYLGLLTAARFCLNNTHSFFLNYNSSKFFVNEFPNQDIQGNYFYRKYGICKTPSFQRTSFDSIEVFPKRKQ